MLTAASLPETIPVFPLPGALLLPRARLPLHIFEPRYLQMIEDCMKTSARLIGMVQPRSGGVSGAGEGKLNHIGCAGRLTAFSETEDGRYMITLSGVSRFRLISEVNGFCPYRKFSVNWSDFSHDLGAAEADPRLDRAGFMALLKRYFCEEDLQTDWDSLGQAEDELLINSLSMLCPFSPEDKQALLEAPSLSIRRETLVTLMEFALHGGSDEDMM
ncbi:MAG: LON peptidase substrate-binding domain-containing protein [Rhodobacteraceae bacterium]|uniref:LON peptidase substrate-binding domain-containing protein n=1 Tax=Celeribacter sp. HF31 TaxID=2721558 RepID=UPI0014311979|nr:LON peptidase substrate-binding domain-containing protein [Celeribacter sp. HF31]NIY79540.1 ATP-dependent protease [Celeribacter sp. HF31]NVK44662.1 LON peptidase substrate-binding domain-containing protein [Paracoccaceae bacterium]